MSRISFRCPSCGKNWELTGRGAEAAIELGEEPGSDKPCSPCRNRP